MRSIKERPYLIPLACLILVTVWMRIANLGYSDYQGDEIKALATPLSGESLGEFLLEQRKGPVQFLVTYGIQLAHPSLSNQFLTRLPFAWRASWQSIFSTVWWRSFTGARSG